MPLQRCGDGGKGWKWGDKGKCYTGPDGKKQAIKQGLAINPEEFKRKASQIDDKNLMMEALLEAGLDDFLKGEK